MNKNIQTVMDKLDALPVIQQDHITSVLEELVEQAIAGAIFDERIADDPSYRDYVESSLRAAEEDISKGRIISADKVFEDIETRLKSKHGVV